MPGSSIINVKLRVIDSKVFDFISKNVSSHINEDAQVTSAKSFMPIAVCSVDLSESLDVRERQAGLNKLAELLAKNNKAIKKWKITSFAKILKTIFGSFEEKLMIGISVPTPTVEVSKSDKEVKASNIAEL